MYSITNININIYTSDYTFHLVSNESIHKNGLLFISRINILLYFTMTQLTGFDTRVQILIAR